MTADEVWPSYAELPPKLIAGARGLDFVNTVEWRGDPEAKGERLTSYAELATWCGKAGLIGEDQARRLARAAARRPRQAAAVLARALRLRESLASLLLEPAKRQRSLAALNRLLSPIRYRVRLEAPGEGGLKAVAEPDGEPLERPLDAIALAVVELLASDQLERIRRCDDPRCAWLFIDASRNAARRWCDMAACGNRAKARAHQARRRRTARG